MATEDWLGRAQGHAAAGRFEKAQADVSSGLAAEPILLAAVLTLARRLASAGKLTEATPLLNAAARQFPEDPSVLELLGWTLLRQRRTDEAEAAFRQALKSNPESAAGYEGIARVERERGQHLKSSQWFRQAAEREPSGAFWLEASRSLLMGGDPDAAWNEYLSAAERVGEPVTPESRAMLERVAVEIGWRFFGEKRLSKSEAVFVAVRNMEANNASACEGLARIARARGDTVGALDLFQQALAERPADAMLRIEVARQLAALKRWNECAAAYDTLFAAGFDLPKIEAAQRAQCIEQWAVALRLAGRTRDAARAYLIWADHDPTNAQAIVLAAQLAEQAGDLESALDLARRLVKPSEVWRGARLPVARCLASCGRAALAEEVLAPLIGDSPSDSGTAIAYATANASLWMREFQALSDVLGPEDFRDLLSASFP
jgi:tetratricopeptide (TPR) repeat protein